MILHVCFNFQTCSNTSKQGCSTYRPSDEKVIFPVSRGWPTFRFSCVEKLVWQRQSERYDDDVFDVFFQEVSCRLLHCRAIENVLKHIKDSKMLIPNSKIM